MDVALRDLVRRFDGLLGLDRASTVPSGWYHDARVAELERRAVFGQSWQLVARAEQLGNPGDYVTADVAGEPVLVVRGSDGVLRAFFNVCRHRAAKVVPAECGNATRLRCNYHGWTYDLEGRLRGTPEFDGVCDFSKDANGLVPMHVEAYGPFVFVHAGVPRGPLRHELAPIPGVHDDAMLDGLEFVERREYELACNWKVFVDNYLDGGYHVNAVHPALAGVLDYKNYTVDVYERTSLQKSPLREPDEGRHDTTAKDVRKGGFAHYWWAYPNLMFNFYPGVLDTNLVLPIAPNRCRVIVDFWFERGLAKAKPEFVRESIDVGHAIQLEDVGICEEVQRGLGSRSYETGRFSISREGGGYHFHRLLADALASAVP
ncbi:MAG: aromatic ring-hydroxylating dioxygenase subunit alpha [Polyangiaceae bacterium]